MSNVAVSAKMFRHVYIHTQINTLDNGQEMPSFKVVEFEDEFARANGTKATSAKKRCLANMCHASLTDDLIIVTIEDIDQNGKRIEPEYKTQALCFALFQLGGDRVPLWTQSSGKNGTFYCVPEDVFEKLASRFDRENDAEKFAAYIGLLFSDITSETFLVSPKYVEVKHGEDGNSVAPLESWGRGTCQFRALAMDEEGWPMLLGKGIMTGIASAKHFELNDTQVKWSDGKPLAVYVAKTNVNDKPIKIPATFEMIQLLKDTRRVWNVLRPRVKEATLEILSLIQEGNEVALLERLGQLGIQSDGTLGKASRNVLSALRANMPWCEELEVRLGRLFVSELAKTIAPSAGLWGWGYLAIQHDELGANVGDWDKAKCFAFRLPLTSDSNLVPFNKVLKNGKVSPEAMDLMDGDSDGDRIVVISDPEIVALVRENRVGFVVDHKPTKSRNKSPLTADRLIDLALQAMEDAPFMGSLTMRQHSLLSKGEMEDAAFCGWLAQMSPMLIKWQIEVDGVPARDVMRDELRKGIGLAQWKQMQRKASELSSPRGLAALRIRKPATIIDRCWNWMVEACQVWTKDNPLKALSLPTVARVSWQAHPDMVVGGTALRWRRSVVSVWGAYWAENYGKDVNHRSIYEHVEEMGKQATIDELVALLMWRPVSGRSGFALKWHVLGTRWEEVLGYRKEVQDRLDEKAARHQRFINGKFAVALAALD